MKLVFSFLTLATIAGSLPLRAAVERPRLIVAISIDQFRADYLQRFQHLFLPASGNKIGGFNYLMQKGAYFSHAEYGLLQNMTCPGHATILTGSFAYQNGIPNNDWYDMDTQEFTYCAEDRAHKTVGADQKNPHVGTSPKNLKTTTFGDELKNAFPNAKVVSIALKDRSSIMMGGHRSDISLWFDQEAFQWVSSTFYVKELPAWVKPLNEELKKLKGKELVWEKKLDKTPNPNPLVAESKYTKEMGTSFPHKAPAGGVSSLLFPIAITTPVDLAERAIDGMKLGQDNVTDVLAISFSSHDYVGHNFGSESDEIRETTVLEDAAFSRLFNYLNKKVPGGLANVWIVLTADHGVADNIKIMGQNKIPAGAIDQSVIVKEIESYMNEKYGKVSGNWLLEPSELNFFFNWRALRDKELSLFAIRDEVAQHLMTKKHLFKGIAQIFSGSDVRRGTLPPEQFAQQIRRTYFEGRSGDIMMIQEPNWVVAYGTTTHMSGYSYDRYVPVIFAGKPFVPGTYAGGHVVDIAPTLAFLTGIVPPASSEGAILKKAIKANR